MPATPMPKEPGKAGRFAPSANVESGASKGRDSGVGAAAGQRIGKKGGQRWIGRSQPLIRAEWISHAAESLGPVTPDDCP